MIISDRFPNVAVLLAAVAALLAAPVPAGEGPRADAPRVLRVDQPGYAAEISERSVLSIRADKNGPVLFTERFFLHSREGKEMASAALAASSLAADEAKKVFTYRAETPDSFRMVKTVTLMPEAFRVEYVVNILGEAPLRDGEATLVMNAEAFGGQAFTVNGVEAPGRLPRLNGEEPWPAVPNKIKTLHAGEWQIVSKGPNVDFLDSRQSPSRWAANSFRLRDSVRPLAAGREYAFSLTVSREPAGAAKAPMEEMQVVKHTPLDLTRVVNMGFRENDVADDGQGGWTDEGPGGNDFREFPTGEQVFAGVPFSIIDPAANGGKSCLVLGGQPKRQFPASVDIPVGALATSIYFLHTAAWQDAGAVADYAVRYADGTQVDIPLVYGRDITGWWNPVNTENSAVGWRGKCPRYAPVGINVFGWNNPHPEKEVASIRFSSRMLTCVPILAGVTLSNQKVSLVRSEETRRVTDTTGWVPFVPAHRSVLDNALNLSAQVKRHAPAGKYGFVAARNGRFEFADGRRARFFGGSLVAGANFPPTREDADTLAAYIAKMGCNIVRMHMYDNTQFTGDNKPRISIFGDSGPSGGRISPEHLDRFDYLVHALKENGVYIYLDLHGPRAFTEADGVQVGLRDQHGNSREKRGFYFDPATIASNRKFVEELLTHKNPHTGNRYVDEPAIAFVDFTNENTLFLFGIWWRLDGVYERQLAEHWNAWLVRRYGGRDRLAAAWGKHLADDEDPAAGTVRVTLPVGMPLGSWGGQDTPRLTDATRFTYELQTGFYLELRDFVRGLGLKVPVTGSHPLFLNPPDIQSQAQLDFVDQHPYFFGRRAMSQADLPDYDTVTQIALSRVRGKPVTVTEWNYHNKDIFPWRSDAPLFVSAYAALQDVDCLIVHAYSHSYTDLKHILWNQNIISDPIFVGQMQAAANVFLRGDVQPARTVRVAAAYTKDSVFSRASGRPPVGFSPYRQRLETVFDAPPELKADPLPADGPVLESDTGELVWRRRDGVLFVNAAKTQAVIGRLEKSAAENPLTHLAVAAHPVDATAISVTSLDDLPLARSAHMLLTACGRGENTGMVWDASGFKAIRQGKAPVLIEPVVADIALRALDAPAGLKVYPLQPDGTRMAPLAAEAEGSTLRFRLSAPTIYYEIAKDRP